MNITNYPLVLLPVSFFSLAAAAWLGTRLDPARPPRGEREQDELEVIRNAALTLLALLIGFTFSMAISRYDQRKAYEEAEANAIGTEFVRADLFPAADAAKVRALLRAYLDQRVLFYTVNDAQQLQQVRARTDQLETDLWAAVRAPALAQPSQLHVLTVAGMNDVLNSEGYTQAAWLNRIPVGAWALMMAMAVCANVLIGVGATQVRRTAALLLVLPLIVSIAFFLIADIESPRTGVIHVTAQNLERLVPSLRGP